LISLITVLAIFIVNTGESSGASNVITVRADIWPPYNDDPASGLPGSMVEIIKIIYQKAGYEIDYQVMPWARSVMAVEQGTFDAIIGASTECPECITPKESIGEMINHFYVKKGGNWRYTGPDSLKTVSVGVIADYSYTDDFDAYMEKNKNDSKKIDVMHADDALQKNIKKLLAGRIGAIIENTLVFPWTVKAMGLKESDFEDAGELENSKLELFIKFSPHKDASQTYADIFDKGMKELRSSGELKEILAKYGMTDWK
jgi:polar amino acid transport system substrate-binding protein